MCGIVGLYLKNTALETQLGALLSTMLGTMADRGSDSAGFAVYGPEGPDIKITIRGESDAALKNCLDGIENSLGTKLRKTRRHTHMVVSVPPECKVDAYSWLKSNAPDTHVFSSGRRLEIYKEVGSPNSVANHFDLASMIGSHSIGHTRMATESAVTASGAHPYSTGMDECLVHNGSLSNHNDVRRRLEREGLTFATKNDSEVAAGYLSWRMRTGASLREALESSLTDLDGFFTFVVGTKTGFAVVRDPIACKPAVMAETDEYVAFGSEYRALVGLPGIEQAHIFEPEPARVYTWERQ